MANACGGTGTADRVEKFVPALILTVVGTTASGCAGVLTAVSLLLCSTCSCAADAVRGAICRSRITGPTPKFTNRTTNVFPSSDTCAVSAPGQLPSLPPSDLRTSDACHQPFCWSRSVSGHTKDVPGVVALVVTETAFGCQLWCII